VDLEEGGGGQKGPDKLLSKETRKKVRKVTISRRGEGRDRRLA